MRVAKSSIARTLVYRACVDMKLFNQEILRVILLDTRQLNEAARILQIQMLYHVIVGHPTTDRQGYFSFKESAVIG
jgi:hypothetical protein